MFKKLVPDPSVFWQKDGRFDSVLFLRSMGLVILMIGLIIAFIYALPLGISSIVRVFGMLILGFLFFQAIPSAVIALGVAMLLEQFIPGLFPYFVPPFQHVAMTLIGYTGKIDSETVRNCFALSLAVVLWWKFNEHGLQIFASQLISKPGKQTSTF